MLSSTPNDSLNGLTGKKDLRVSGTDSSTPIRNDVDVEPIAWMLGLAATLKLLTQRNKFSDQTERSPTRLSREFILLCRR
jgi:hypothetical protein